MTIPIYHVDAFTHEPFKGNPAAVCILPGPGNPIWMQHIAREMNLSETAFLHGEQNEYSLRWFTPQVEVELCGHATLASAHVLWESGLAEKGKPIAFHTLSGRLTAAGNEGWIELDFPANELVPGDLTDATLDALGVTPLAILRSGEKVLIELESEEEVRRVKPNFAALRKLPGRGIVITARSETPGVDFVSRYFAPWIGVNEDPVTGSAHCMLGPYWQKKLAKNHLNALQVSRRGGALKVRLSGDRVYIAGQAVTISRGEVTTPFIAESL